MLLHEVEGIRRSFAMSKELTEHDAEQLLETCARLLEERVHIERVLADLRPPWSRTQKALNELQAILKPRR